MFKTLAAIVLIIFLVFASVWLVQGIKYSYKVQTEMDGVETVCYFDRGFIKTPFVRICKTNDSLTFSKKEFFED